MLNFIYFNILFGYSELKFFYLFKKTHIEKVFESFREFSTQHWDVYIEFIYAINVHQQFVLVVIFLLTVLVESPCCVKYFVESVWVDAVCLSDRVLVKYCMTGELCFERHFIQVL